MKKCLKSFLCLFLCAILVFSFCSCKNDDQNAETTTTEPPTTTKPAPKMTDYNRLTGLDNLSDEAKGKRPVAIMINNISASLPQYGISEADLMFECLVEGGITRMMAVFADYTKVPNVCSIRSCRYYYPIFAYGLDAVYLCFGCNPTLGKKTLKALNIDYFDGAEKYEELIFGRDPNRLGSYSREHTAYVKGENLSKLYDKYNVRREYRKGKDKYIFSFKKKNGKLSSKVCDKVTLNFSPSYFSTFTYDKDNRVYLKQHSGKPHMDSASAKQLSYTNVFALETYVGLYGNGPLVEMDWHGGKGYYLSNGTVKEIKWSKKSGGKTIKITDLNGKTVKVNKGNSYFGFVNNGNVKL